MNARIRRRGARFVWSTLSVVALVGSIGTLYVCERVAMVGVGYRMDECRRRIAELSVENKRLCARLEQLSSPLGLAELSGADFRRPEAWQVVRLTVQPPARPARVDATAVVRSAPRGRLASLAGDFARGFSRLVGGRGEKAAEPLARRRRPVDKS